jgi:hypothetical protein
MMFVAAEPMIKLGGFFLLLGTVFILGNRRERKKYYETILLTRKDIKESLTYEPERPWLNAWRIGGRISLILGALLLSAGGVLWFTMR